MITLAIDTSSFTGSVAVVEDGVTKGVKTLESLPGHSESLHYAMRSVVDGAGVKLQSLDLLAVGVGPGSFTGLRVGLAAMKGLSLSLEKPLMSAPSLLALAMNALDLAQGRPVCAAIDARRGDVFAAIYSFKSSGVVTLLEDRMTIPSELLVELDRLGTEVVCVGDAFLDAGKGPIVGFGPNMSVPADRTLHFPSAVNVALIASKRFLNGERDVAEALEPRYLRPLDFKKSG